MNRKPIFDSVRSILAARGQPGFTQLEVADLDRAIDAATGAAPSAPLISTGLSDADFTAAAASLNCAVAQIKAVWEVETGGSGWFNDIRGDILQLDGPGGFIDGSHLPKILFEAHHFARLTKGKYNLTAPNISSPSWNKKLYVGGQGEWERLWKAMGLDRHAALMSASVGAPQIMGFNHKLAGYDTVEAFWDAMKASERNQLMAFVSFIKNTGLGDELRRISTNHADCAPFARGYNGKAYAANQYDVKIARAFKKWRDM